MKDFKLLICCRWFILSATTTVNNCEIPDSSKSACNVFSLVVFRLATQKLSLKWLIDFSTLTPILCFVPFLRTSFYTRIGSEIFFRVNIEHSAAWRSWTWILTVTDTTTWLVLSVVFPFHFGTYEFHGRQ